MAAEGSQAERHTNERNRLAILAARQAHEAQTGCCRRLPCRDCDEEMRRLWYGGEDA